MDWFVKAFIRASLLWFALGITLGLIMAAQPAWMIYHAAHAHMNVAGFITMMIFGVGYQLLPRLFGHKLFSNMLAGLHLWLANIGLALMVYGFGARAYGRGPHTLALTLGGSMYALGALLFVFNLWRTFDMADARHRERTAAGTGRTGLPTRE